MIKNLLLLSFLFVGLSGFSQEDFSQGKELYIGKLEIQPSLSDLRPLFPSSNYTIPEINIFAEQERPQADMLAYMEMKRNERPREVDIDFPFTNRRKKKAFNISGNVDFIDNTSNYDPYTGKLKNPVYKEMRSRFYDFNYSLRGNRFYSPYGYSRFR